MSDRAAAAPRERAFFAASALLFLASAAGTILWCAPMAGGMRMPGGWIMPMAWMRMPGQTWPGATASFEGMWIVMMVAMMLPSLVPMLARYRGSLRATDAPRLGGLTVIAGAGYFLVWAVVGAGAYAIGLAIAAAEMRSPALSRAVPIATGLLLLLAGGVQLTAWKARQLAVCRLAPACDGSAPPDASSAWRHGLRLGAHCLRASSIWMIVLLVIGVMDLWVMAVVTAAITVERLAPRPEPVARATGILVIAAGLFLIARALTIQNSSATSSASPSLRAGSPGLAAGPFRTDGFILRDRFQPRERPHPEMLQECAQLAESFLAQPVVAPRPLLANRDQPRLLEHAQML